MRVFLNELALADAWTSTSSVHPSPTDILQARQRQPVLRDALYCTHGMGGVRTPGGVPLSRAAQELPRDTRLQFFEWVAKHGPFVEDDREAIDEDLFFFEASPVEELGFRTSPPRASEGLQNFTFPDPEGGRDIVCFWPAKVSTAAIRMYFDWPAQRGASRLRVVYIGPHI